MIQAIVSVAALVISGDIVLVLSGAIRSMATTKPSRESVPNALRGAPPASPQIYVLLALSDTTSIRASASSSAQPGTSKTEMWPIAQIAPMIATLAILTVSASRAINYLTTERSSTRSRDVCLWRATTTTVLL